MRPRSVGLALLAVAVLTGCGSVSASVIDLRHDAGLICRHTNRAFGPLPALPKQGQAAAFLSAGIERLKRQLTKLRRVGPPHDVADVYQAALAAMGQEIDVLQSAVQAIHRGQDPALAFKALRQQLTPLQSQADNAWQALEIPACLQ
ncbi:MAG TPA: hypothetical protein VGF70_05925 [Solirubrobacteraceae bacterium]|jgi:hypothetical protein